MSQPPARQGQWFSVVSLVMVGHNDENKRQLGPARRTGSRNSRPQCPARLATASVQYIRKSDAKECLELLCREEHSVSTRYPQPATASTAGAETDNTSRH
eukprot:1838235-Pyramimonas_sp.AAC.1